MKSLKIVSKMCLTATNPDFSGKWHSIVGFQVIFPGHKNQKLQFKFMCGCDASGSEKVPILFIETAKSPWHFNKKSPKDLCIPNNFYKKTWVTSSLFLEWLSFFDDYIGQTANRKALLLMSNCSSHGSLHTQPELRNVKVTFLPPNTACHLQTLDAGIMAAMKFRYHRRQIKYAAD